MLTAASCCVSPGFPGILASLAASTSSHSLVNCLSISEVNAFARVEFDFAAILTVPSSDVGQPYGVLYRRKGHRSRYGSSAFSRIKIVL